MIGFGTRKTQQTDRKGKMLLYVVGNHVTFQRRGIGQRAKWNYIPQILNRVLFGFII